MKKRKSLWLILVLLMLAGAAAVLLYLRADLRYLVKETVSGWFRERVAMVELDAEALKVDKKSLSDLIAEENCTYDQSLLLVNGTYRLSDDFVPDVSEYKTSGVLMNRCIMDAYAALAAAVGDRFDEKLYVMSSYRSAAESSMFPRPTLS